MQNIAWQANNQGEYNVPGLGALLLQRNNDNQAAFQNIGQFAGALGAGAVGIHQGAEDPAAFGDGTSPASGGLQAGLMNFTNAYANGNGPAQNGFSRLVNGSGGGGGGGDAGTNFRQFEQLGKMADNTRALLTDPNSPLKDQKVMGFTDDQWKHLGTADKIDAFKSYKNAMDVKNTMLGYDTAVQHLSDLQQQHRAGEQQYRAGEQNLELVKQNLAVGKQTLADLQQKRQAAAAFPNNLQAAQMGPGMAAMAQGAGPVAIKDLTPYQVYAQAVKSGIDPLQASQMGENLSRMADVSAKSARNNMPQQITMPDGTVLFAQPDTQNPPILSPFNKPDRTAMTDYQQAQLQNVARSKYLEAKRQVDSLSAMADDKFAQSLLPGAQEALQSAQDELQSLGINQRGGPAAAATAGYKSGDEVRAAYQAGKIDKATARKILLEQFKDEINKK